VAGPSLLRGSARLLSVPVRASVDHPPTRRRGKPRRRADPSRALDDGESGGMCAMGKRAARSFRRRLCRFPFRRRCTRPGEKNRSRGGSVSAGVAGPSPRRAWPPPAGQHDTRAAIRHQPAAVSLAEAFFRIRLLPHQPAPHKFVGEEEEPDAAAADGIQRRRRAAVRAGRQGAGGLSRCLCKERCRRAWYALLICIVTNHSTAKCTRPGRECTSPSTVSRYRTL
jgi:hypothetical protein